jgi:hypothetical protein
MAGIGIAAAIGFVFALSYFGNAPDQNGGELAQDAPPEVQRALEPAPSPKPADDASSFAKDSSGEMDSAPAGESAMMVVDSAPSLTTVIAMNANRQVIGEVAPGMEFQVGEPVVFQANFFNPNDAAISDHFLAVSVRSGDVDEQAAAQSEYSANLQGAIGGNSNIALELHWTPQKPGSYAVLVFSMTQADFASTADVEPISAIQIEVLE